MARMWGVAENVRLAGRYTEQRADDEQARRLKQLVHVLENLTNISAALKSKILVSVGAGL